MPNRPVPAAFAVLIAVPSAFVAVPPGVTQQLPPGYDVLGSASMRAGAPARSIVIAARGPFFTVQNGVACGAQHWTDYITFRFDGGRGFMFDNERS